MSQPPVETSSSSDLLTTKFKTFLELLKEIGSISGILSAVFGGLILWLYCSNLGLLSTLANAEDTILLVTYFILGYLLIFGNILFTSILVPASIISLNDDLLSLQNVDWSQAGSDESSTQIRWWWSAILFGQFLALGIFIALKVFKLWDVHVWQYLIALCLVNVFISNKICRKYETIRTRFSSADSNTVLPRENKFVYIVYIAVLLVLTILPFYLILSLVMGLQIDWDNKTSWQWIGILIVFYIGFLIYSVVMGHLIVPLSQKHHNQRFFVMVITGIGLTIMAHYINFQGILNTTAQAVGIQTPAKEKDLYVYRFKKQDIDNELRTFFANEYKQKEDYIYVNGYSIFNFRKTLVLCPSSIAVKDLREFRFRCIDVSGLEYKRFNKRDFDLM